MRELIACDTETTGFDPETCSLLEVAATTTDSSWWQFIEFEGEIPADAKGTHHITEEDVRPGAPRVGTRDAAIQTLAALGEGRVPVFHNLKFDKMFLPELEGLDVICTLQCARHLYPDAPNHKNQTLRYWLKTKPRPEVLEGLAPHRGLYDAEVTYSIAMHMLEAGHSVDDLIHLTNTPVLLRTVSFGKYKGELWKDVPRDYRNWMRRSGNWADDVDVMYILDVLDGRK